MFQIGYGIDYLRRKISKPIEPCADYSLEQCNDVMREYIAHGEVFMATKFGSTELHTVSYELMKPFVSKSRLDMMMSKLYTYSGFFPKDAAYMSQFSAEIFNAIGQANILGNVTTYAEDYIAKQYGNECKKAEGYLEPFGIEHPWTEALEGKKVLVIHPFAETIEDQYKKWGSKIHNNSNLLPQFELHTIKAVQTLAEEKDPRFTTWFEALDYMYNEAMKVDFDVAIIGCGAYGMPLAGKIKAAGRSAIHMGGSVQLLFGIKGNRWGEENPMYNEYWVRPSEREKISGASTIEGACYW